MTSSSEQDGYRPADPGPPQTSAVAPNRDLSERRASRREARPELKLDAPPWVSQLEHLAQPPTGRLLWGQFIGRHEKVVAQPGPRFIEYVMADKAVEVIEP